MSFRLCFFATLFGYVPFSIARIIEGKPVSLKPNNPGLLTFRALLHVAGLSLGFFAFAKLPMVEAYVLLFCSPLIISVLAVWFLDEHIALVRWLAIIMGLAGVIVVLRPTPDSITIGHVAALAAAFCGAGSAVISRKISATENMATMILFPLLANIIVTGGALYFVYVAMPFSDLATMFLIGVLGLIGPVFCIERFSKCASGFRWSHAIQPNSLGDFVRLCVLWRNHRPMGVGGVGDNHTFWGHHYLGANALRLRFKRI